MPLAPSWPACRPRPPAPDEQIMGNPGQMYHRYLPRIAEQVIPHLPPEALDA